MSAIYGVRRRWREGVLTAGLVATSDGAEPDFGWCYLASRGNPSCWVGAATDFAMVRRYELDEARHIAEEYTTDAEIAEVVMFLGSPSGVETMQVVEPE